MTEKHPIAEVADIPAGGFRVFKVREKSILVAHAGGTFYAVENRCPHLGLPLSAGKIEGTNITCAFHGSKFDLHTGENMDWVMGIGGMKLPDWSRSVLALGRRPSPVKIFRVSVEDGRVFVEI